MGFGKYELCGYCRYCNCEDIGLNKNGQFPCTREKIWVYADALPKKSNCFWQVTSYNLSGRDPAIKFSKKYRGFYITTAVYEKLNIQDNGELDKLYLFRHTYLENCETGKQFLHDYDIFAPRLGKLILLSDVIDARLLYEVFIRRTLRYIEEDDLKSASELYSSMYVQLKEKFIFEPYLRKEEAKHTFEL